MTAAPTGMPFSISPLGVPIPQNWTDYGGPSETAFTGDWQLIVTGVPAGVTYATVATMILSAPVAIPLPFKSFHWQVAYSALSGPVTATAF